MLRKNLDHVVQIDVYQFAVNVIVNLSINSIIGRQRKVAPLTSGIGPFMCDLLYRHECFTGKYTTRKIHENSIRDPSGLFSIISHVSLSMS